MPETDSGGPDGGQGRLFRTVGPLQFFALGFGCIVGAAWIVSLGEFLQRGGPGGAVLGFVLGGAAMLAIGACYAELAAHIPEAGGEFIYCLRIYGRTTGFMVGWFVTLFLLSVTVFEAVALAWTLQILFPALQGPALYTVLGYPVNVADIGIGIAGTILLACLNYRGTAVSVSFHSVVTYGFIAVTTIVIVWGICWGSPRNLEPLWGTGDARHWWNGIFWIFSSCAFFLYGFPAIPQTIEERRHGVPLSTVAATIILSIFAATVFYVAIVVSSSMAAPWTSSAGRQLAVAVALQHVPLGRFLAAVTLFAAAASILKTWNAIYLMAARMLLAQARESLMPAWFARIHPRFGSPSAAILFIGMVNLAGLFCGRAAIVPIINMSSMCLTITFVLCSIGVLVLRRRYSAPSQFRVPGGSITVWIAVACSVVMAITALAVPFQSPYRVLPSEWTLLLVWALLGLVFAMVAHRRAAASDAVAIAAAPIRTEERGS